MRSTSFMRPEGRVSGTNGKAWNEGPKAEAKSPERRLESSASDNDIDCANGASGFQSGGNLPGTGFFSSSVRMMPLPLASSAWVKKPAQPFLIVNKGLPSTVLSNRKKKSQM